MAFMFWIQGNFIAPSVGVLDGRRIFWREFVTPVLVNFAVWLIALGILFFYRRWLFRLVIPVCLILLATQMVNFTSQYSTMLETPNSKLYPKHYSNHLSLSIEKNLVIIILDTFQSDIFEEIVSQNPQIEDKFNGFTYYPDTAGGYPTTILSKPLLITGKFYQNQQLFKDFIEKVYSTDSLHKNFDSNGYDVPLLCTPLYCSDQISDSMVKNPINQWLDKNELTDLFIPTVIRSTPTITYFGSQKVKYLLDLYFDRKLVWSDQSPKHFQTDKQLLTSILTMTTTDNMKPTFKLYWFNAPHQPFYLNEKGEFQIQIPDRQGQVNHSAGALGYAIDILDKYKELGIYDQTMIVIMADHGFGPLGYKSTPEDKIIKNEISAAAMPLLLVKPFNSQDPLAVDNTSISFENIGQDLFRYMVENDPTLITNFTPTSSPIRYFYDFDRDADLNTSYLPELQQYIITGPVRDEASWRKQDHVK